MSNLSRAHSHTAHTACGGGGDSSVLHAHLTPFLSLADELAAAQQELASGEYTASQGDVGRQLQAIQGDCAVRKSCLAVLEAAVRAAVVHDDAASAACIKATPSATMLVCQSNVVVYDSRQPSIARE